MRSEWGARAESGAYWKYTLLTAEAGMSLVNVIVFLTISWFMKAFIVLIAALVASVSAFGQSDEELLAQVRKHYYNLQSNLSLYQRVTVNDTLFCSIKGGAVVKATFSRGALQEEYFFYPDSDWPYFVYAASSGQENRYYYDSDTRALRMFKWINQENKEVDPETKEYRDTAWHYMIRGKNLKTVAENRKVKEEDFARVKKLLDSLRSLSIKYDTVISAPFASDDPERLAEDDGGLSVGDEAYYSYLSEDKTIKVEENISWMDCAGGSSTEDIDYHLLETNEVISYGKRTQGSYNYSNPFYYEINYIKYNNGAGKCYEINTWYIRGEYLREEWKQKSCR